ncbi:hypothetical protein ACC848_41260, partial [Rhizobium johnstonii]
MQAIQLFAAMLALGLSGATCASASELPDPVAVSSTEKPAEKQVCKSQARTGTRFVKQVCKTRTQWTEEAEQARRDAQDE